MAWEIVDKPLTQSLRYNTTLAYPRMASHLMVYQDGKVSVQSILHCWSPVCVCKLAHATLSMCLQVGKSLYVMPLTAAMVAYLEVSFDILFS